MQFLAREHRFKVVEVTISADYADPAKRSPIMQGFNVFNGVLKLVGQTRPLLFMGVPGLVVLLAGLLMGLLVVSIYAHVHQLAVGYALISLLCTLMGGISLFSGIMLHSIRALLIGLLRSAAIDDIK